MMATFQGGLFGGQTIEVDPEHVRLGKSREWEYLVVQDQTTAPGETDQSPLNTSYYRTVYKRAKGSQDTFVAERNLRWRVDHKRGSRPYDIVEHARDKAGFMVEVEPPLFAERLLKKMDPNATYDWLLAEIADGNWASAVESARDLWSPRTTSPRPRTRRTPRGSGT